MVLVYFLLYEKRICLQHCALEIDSCYKLFVPDNYFTQILNLVKKIVWIEQNSRAEYSNGAKAVAVDGCLVIICNIPGKKTEDVTFCTSKPYLIQSPELLQKFYIVFCKSFLWLTNINGIRNVRVFQHSSIIYYIPKFQPQ